MTVIQLFFEIPNVCKTAYSRIFQRSCFERLLGIFFEIKIVLFVPFLVNVSIVALSSSNYRAQLVSFLLVNRSSIKF